MTNKLKKPLLASALLATLTVGGVATIGVSAAQDIATNNSIISKLAERFNVDESEVQAVFEENRDEKRAERDELFNSNLQNKVDSGEITEEQKTAIQQKREELHATQDAQREELKAWAEEQGIDVHYILRGHRNKSGSFPRHAVENEQLTEEQKSAVEQKKEELENSRQQTREELQQWADENGLELHDFFGDKGGSRHRN